MATEEIEPLLGCESLELRAVMVEALGLSLPQCGHS